MSPACKIDADFLGQIGLHYAAKFDSAKQFFKSKFACSLTQPPIHPKDIVFTFATCLYHFALSLLLLFLNIGTPSGVHLSDDQSSIHIKVNNFSKFLHCDSFSEMLSLKWGLPDDI